MIITLTLNPAVDQTMFLERLATGDVNRVRETQLDPAGKGINVSRIAHRLGWPTIAFGVSAGESGVIVQRALDDEGVQHVLVLAGSLPPTAPDDTYARYIRLAREQGVTAILVSSGEPLRCGLDAVPSVIKPNVAEAEELLDHALGDVDAVVKGARELAARGIDVVVISMGAEGSVCIQGERVWRIVAPVIERHSAVGSGDSFVAGLAIALAPGDDLVEGLRLGTATGAATAMSEDTALASEEDVSRLLPEVGIEVIDA